MLKTKSNKLQLRPSKKASVDLNGLYDDAVFVSSVVKVDAAVFLKLLETKDIVRSSFIPPVLGSNSLGKFRVEYE